MRKYIFWLMIFTFAAVVMSIRADTDDRLNIRAGISVYPDPSVSPDVYLEFPFSVNRSSLDFLINDSITGDMIAGVYAELIIYDTLDNPVDSTSTTFLTGAADSAAAEAEDVQIFNRLRLIVAPGLYKGKLTVTDFVSKRIGSFLYDKLEIEPPDPDKLSLSSPELAYDIKVAPSSETARANPLEKNGCIVIPNPMGIYMETDTALFVYSELYNLNFTPGQEDSFTVQYQIANSRGSSFEDFGIIQQLMPGSTAVITNLLKIVDYPAERYTLKMVATDLTNNQSDTVRTGFILFPKSGTLPGVVQYTIKHPYDTASLKTKMQLVKFLLAPEQAAMLEGLNDIGKERYINQFFQDKDPTPQDENNEYLNDKFSQYVYSNKQFSTVPEAVDGWQTDRGRVLLQYGVWSDRNESLVAAYTKPYEIWEYHGLQGGAVFVFQDITGYGNYKLVHSTARGEIYDQQWADFLKETTPEMID